MSDYRKQWIQHLDRIQDTIIPKGALQYKPKGKRSWKIKEMK
jgi:hypothetical protein